MDSATSERLQGLPSRLTRMPAVQRGVAACLRMRRLNNGQKVDFAEIDAGGGPETGIPLVVALFPRAYAGRTTSLNG